MADESAAGRKLGKYTVIEELGRGGMAVVYKARDEELSRIVALKVLNQDAVGDKGALSRFEFEAKTTARLDHPNIIKIYDIGREGGLMYFAMEYLPKSSLHEIIKRDGKFSVERAVQIVKSVLLGLHCAHEAGVVHRDIKPENIMMDANGRVVVVDFGIAKSQKGARLTQTGILLGTPYYMSPEQITGKDVKAQSDIYSVGVVLFELLTASVPFQADSTFMITYKHCTQAPPDPRQFNEKISEELRRVMLKSLEKDPNARYQSAKEMAEDLERVERGEVVAAEEPRDVDVASHPAFAKAMASYKAGDYPAAVKHFETVTKDAVPVEYAALAQRWIGTCHFDQGRYAEAIVHYKKTLDTWPETQEAARVPTFVDGCCFQQLEVGTKLYDAGRREESLQAFRALIDTLRDQGIPVDNNLWSQHAEGRVAQIGKELARRRFLRQLGIVVVAAILSSAAALAAYFRFVNPFAYHSLAASVHAAAGNPELEQAELQAALALKPDDARTLFRIARSLALGGGSRAEALTAAERSVTRDPTLIEAHELLGELYGQEGSWDKAAASLERARSLGPPSARLLTNLGYVEERRGKAGPAMELYRAALERDPGYANAYNNIGAWQLEHKDYELAAKALRQAVRADPRLATAHYNLGKTFHAQALDLERRRGAAAKAEVDDLMGKKAFEEFSQALLLDPGLADAHVYLALLAVRRGDYDTAREALGRALFLEPTNARTNYEYAQLLERDQNTRDAVRYLKLAAQYAPGEALYRKSLVGLLERMQLWDEAERVYDELIKSQPPDADFYRGKARCQRMRRRFAEATATSAEALRVGGRRPELLGDLGEALLLSGQTEPACVLLTEAAQAAPSDARVLGLLGDAFGAASRWEDAERMYAASGTADALYKQGRCLIQLGRLRAAEEAFRRGLTLKDDHLGALNELGLLVGREGRRDEALRLLQRSLSLDPYQREAPRLREAQQEFGGGRQ